MAQSSSVLLATKIETALKKCYITISMLASFFLIFIICGLRGIVYSKKMQKENFGVTTSLTE